MASFVLSFRHAMFCEFDILFMFHALFCGSVTCSILYVCRALFCYCDMFYSMDAVYVYVLCHDCGMLYSMIIVSCFVL